MATFTRFEDIEAWKSARVLSNDIYKLVSNRVFDDDKRLRSQMNGSSGSVMDNIAEGFARGGNAEFKQYLWISKGSSAELRSQLYRCKDRGWVENDYFINLYKRADTIEKMIEGLIKHIKTSNKKGRKYS